MNAEYEYSCVCTYKSIYVFKIGIAFLNKHSTYWRKTTLQIDVLLFLITQHLSQIMY